MEYKKYSYYNEVLSYIKINYSNKELDFLNNFIKSDNETFNKILVSIIREKLLPFLNFQLIPNEINQFKFIGLNGQDVQEINFKINWVFGFDFFTFEKPVYIKNEKENKIIENSLELIDILKENKLYNDIDQFKIEIVNSITNMALISTLYSDFSNKLKEKAKINNWNYLSDYVDYKFKKNQLYDKFLFYDQIHLNGHHIHPSFKLRIGLNCEQVVKYSYELKKEIPMRFVGLNNSVARFNMMNENDNPTNYFFKLFPNVKEPIQNYFVENQININEYLIYPMFPYQITDTFPIQFKNELENKQLIILPENIKIKSYPTSSLRNLIPVIENETNPPHIKFSVPIQTTNFVRFMPNEFIPIGTSVSLLLERIKEIETKLFKDKVVFLNEIGGIYHSNKEIKYQNFAIIWKENTNLFIKSNSDQPISSCSLFNISPISNDNSTTVLGELIKQYYEFHSKPKNISFNESIRNWFKLYSKLLIEPNLILLTKYGVSLESHLQNSVYTYKNGEPKLLILKDWSGIVIKNERLLKQKDLIDLKLIESIPKEIKLSDLEFYKMFSHSILHNNLCQIIIGICKEFSNDIDENTLWNDCFNIMNCTFDIINLNGLYKNEISDDQEQLFNKELKCKALTGMRLLTKNKILLPFNVRNPLNKFK